MLIGQKLVCGWYNKLKLLPFFIIALTQSVGPAENRYEPLFLQTL